MFFMGILGGPAIRTQMRAVRDAADDGRDATAAALRRHASHPFLWASLRIRAAVGFAIIYLMVGKPDLGESLVLMVVAVAVGAAMSLPQWRGQSSPVGA
jgi:hypothetical protein